ncbi:MAG TPA: HEAT repeat domain-containing protein [Verrucomicrobiae bacterium]
MNLFSDELGGMKDERASGVRNLCWRGMVAVSAAMLYAAVFCAPVRAAEVGEEQRLIAILKSNSTPQEKDTACVQLKQIATAAAVPALAALLADPQLSQSARYVLEPMELPEAGGALVDALGRTSGLTKAGIIDSLGNRREEAAVDALAKALGESDVVVVESAATALGKIGGATAVKALNGALPGGNESVHGAIVDGLLRAANQFLSAGDEAGASQIFEQLYRAGESQTVRTAAYAGMIRSGGRRSLELVMKGIEGSESAAQMAALQLAREIRDPAAGPALGGLLSKSPPAVQISLIGTLSRRGEISALPAVASVAKEGTPEARIVALEALGELGDATVIPLLAETAATRTGTLQATARRSLALLSRGSVTDVLLSELTSGKPPIQAEMARALGERREIAAIPRLFDLAERGGESARKAALQALPLLVKPTHVDALVQLVTKAQTEVARVDAAQALNAALQRFRVSQAKLELDLLVKALSPGATVESRLALLPICSGLPDPEIRKALREALSDGDSRVRGAAIRALCDTVDLDLLPDLVQIACRAPEENFRTLAIGGCVRLATREEGVQLASSQRVEAFKTLLGTTLSPEQKRLVLSGLAEVPDPEALKLVEPMLADPAVRSEAAQAAVKIAPALADADLATSALKKVAAAETDPATRQAAQAALEQIDARSGFITAWQAAGPFRQANKNYAALFDIPFPPETPEATAVEWRTLPPSTDASRPWSMDLLKLFGGEQCVGYARTSVYSDRDQQARLEIGSDDGAKIWLNGKVVFAKNTARPLQPAQDTVDVSLKAGWNPLLIKVTQNNLGWEFCLRLTKPDGSRIEGLRANPSGGR